MGGLFALFFTVTLASAQTLTPINQIQGEVSLSPMVDKQVTTRGIITALVRNGFYLQTPDAEIDQNPKTSEGIYVFHGSQKPAGIEVGNLVEVSGTVTEFVPRTERYFLPLTEITRPTVKVISQNNPLP